MTIYNNRNNISEDYTYVLASDEIFYNQDEIDGIYEYDISAEQWSLLSPSESRFTTAYSNLKSFVYANNANTHTLNVDATLSNVLADSGGIGSLQPTLYVGINTGEFSGFPDFPAFDMEDKEERESQYIILVITEESVSCVFVKTFVLYSKVRIANPENFTPNDLEYLSAKQTTNAIYDAISKIDILTIVATTNQNKPQKQSGDNRYKIPAISKPQTNCLYLVYETEHNDDVDDGLNYHFGLYVYDDDSGFFKKLDTLTFDIRDYSLDTHTHGNITRDGSLNGAGTGIPLITGAGGKIVAGAFGNNTSINATDFVSCADTRLSDARIPKAHASTDPNAYGAASATEYGHTRVIGSVNNSADAVQSKAIKAYVENAVANVEIDIDNEVQAGSDNPVTNDAIKQYVDRAVLEAQMQGQITVESSVLAGSNNPVTSNGIYNAVKDFKSITLVTGTSESTTVLYGDADKNVFVNGAIILYRFKNNWTFSRNMSMTISANGGSKTYNMLNATGDFLKTGSYLAGKIICFIYYNANLYLIGHITASSTQDGLLSKEDKTKIDGIESEATKTIIDTSLSSASTNPVQNKVIYATLNNKVDKITGKGLSTNDYTTSEKTKLANIEEGATKTIVDSALSTSSSNPVQNQKITAALNNKQDTSNLVNAFSSTLTTTKYPSEKLVKNNLDTKQNISNLTTSFSSTPSNTKYPSEKLVKDSLDTKVDKISGKGLVNTGWTQISGWGASHENQYISGFYNDHFVFISVNNISVTLTTDYQAINDSLPALDSEYRPQHIGSFLLYPNIECVIQSGNIKVRHANLETGTKTISGYIMYPRGY